LGHIFLIIDEIIEDILIIEGFLNYCYLLKLKEKLEVSIS
jgi:hypothetical protein